MSVVVIGCGRSGTNVTLEILRGSPQLIASLEPENKNLCDGSIYDSYYLTKCDTWYFKPDQLESTMNKNPNMKIIWTMRDPRDMVLSKIVHGQPKSLGGDGSDRVADDATPEGCKADIFHMYECYKHITSLFPTRVLVVKMEDVLSDIEKETQRICDFVGLEYVESMCDFPSRMRNPDKKKRYSTIDKSQISIWKNWDTAYSSFFYKNDYGILGIFESVHPLVTEFGYE
mgnify:FL=1|jgi:hypothetical protein|tara:strand:- start:903 stop:1589 length:687 start_codon:yes stop_codon:yes gene_type:complete